MANVVGPNTTSGATGANGAPGSAPLDALIPQSTQDASLLELTIVPQRQTLQFSYVSGSEEYNAYVNSGFHDVFAFFVNGVNHALIPGDVDPGLHYNV